MTSDLRLPSLPAIALAVAASLLALPGRAALAVHEVGAATAAHQVSVDAVVEAVRDTTLAAQVQGAVVVLAVKVGDVVKAGQELVRIDAHAAQQSATASAAQVEAARVGLLVARRDYERSQKLFAKQYISQAALDRASAQWQAAQAQVQSLQAQAGAVATQSGFFSIKAPYGGVVSEVPMALGDMAMPGRALVRLHDPAAYRVTAGVPQALAPALQGAAHAGGGTARPAPQRTRIGGAVAARRGRRHAYGAGAHRLADSAGAGAGHVRPRVAALFLRQRAPRGTRRRAGAPGRGDGRLCSGRGGPPPAAPGARGAQ